MSVYIIKPTESLEDVTRALMYLNHCVGSACTKTRLETNSVAVKKITVLCTILQSCLGKMKREVDGVVVFGLLMQGSSSNHQPPPHERQLV